MTYNKQSRTKKYSKGNKIKSNNIKPKIPIKLKKELEKLSKEWFESLSDKKKSKSKKSVKKFINILKTKCKCQYM